MRYTSINNEWDSKTGFLLCDWQNEAYCPVVQTWIRYKANRRGRKKMGNCDYHTLYSVKQLKCLTFSKQIKNMKCFALHLVGLHRFLEHIFLRK
jgi:hypothetical protein